jgi:DNA invertase Pin-like site-specific DNA recombinase
VEHRESKARQYALADQAQALGWSAERILVIDEDKGQSGKSAQDRAGFQRLLAEVTMEHVGLVLGLEMSRLARSSQDSSSAASSARSSPTKTASTIRTIPTTGCF